MSDDRDESHQVVRRSRFLGCVRKRPMIDIGRPSRAFPVTPPGIRVTYHGGSIELSVGRFGYSRKADRIEICVAQCLLDRRMS